MTKANFAKKNCSWKICVFANFKKFYFIFGPAIDRESSPQSMVEGFRYYIGSILLKEKNNKKASPSVLRRKKAQPTHSQGFQKFNVFRPFSSHPKCQRNCITYPGKSSFQKIRIPFFLPKFLSQKSVFLQLSLFDPANQTKIKE